MDRNNRQEFYQMLMNNTNNVRSYVRYSGIRITRVDELYCEGELTVTPDVLNRWGVVHGGCLATLADTVSGVASCTTGRRAVTLNYGFNFLRPATGARIRCTARAVKSGRTVAVLRCLLTDDRDETVASGEFTFFFTGEEIGQLPEA